MGDISITGRAMKKDDGTRDATAIVSMNVEEPRELRNAIPSIFEREGAAYIRRPALRHCLGGSRASTLGTPGRKGFGGFAVARVVGPRAATCAILRRGGKSHARSALLARVAAYEAAAAAVRDALIKDIPNGIITRSDFNALVEIRELSWKAFSSKFFEV